MNVIGGNKLALNLNRPPSNSLAVRANTIAILGNSVARQDTPFSPAVMLPTGCFQWANYLLKQRLVVSYTATDLEAGYLGVSSDTSAMILARIGSVLSLAPSYCLLMGLHENDISTGVTPATTQANILSMVNILLSNGITPIVCTGFPSLLTDTALKTNSFNSNNDYIRSLRELVEGVITVDVTNNLLDYAETFSKPLASLVSTGPHPNPLGAYYVGKAIFEVLDPILPARDILANHGLSVANGGDSIDSAVENPMLLGVGGTEGTGITGTDTADLWTSTAIGGGAGVVSKVTRTDFPNLAWQQIAYTGDAAFTISDSPRIASNIVAIGDIGVSVGDVIQGYGEFDAVTSPTNFLGFSCLVRTSGGTPDFWTGMNYGSSTIFPLPGDYPAGVIATPKIPVPTGTTHLSMHSKGFASAANASFDVRFGRNSIIKLI